MKYSVAQCVSGISLEHRVFLFGFTEPDTPQLPPLRQPYTSDPPQTLTRLQCPPTPVAAVSRDRKTLTSG
jgi:hypothetical protein